MKGRGFWAFLGNEEPLGRIVCCWRPDRLARVPRGPQPSFGTPSKTWGSGKFEETRRVRLLNSRRSHRTGPEPQATGRPPDLKMAPATTASCQDGGTESRSRSRSRLPSPGLFGVGSATRVAVRGLPCVLGGGLASRPPRAMRLFGWWQLLLWVLGPPACGLEGECVLGPWPGAAGGCG